MIRESTIIAFEIANGISVGNFSKKWPLGLEQTLIGFQDYMDRKNIAYPSYGHMVDEYLSFRLKLNNHRMKGYKHET